MKTETKRPQTLREVEMEVEAEGREWTRQRLQQRLQAEAGQHGDVFPLGGQRLVHRRTRPMQLNTGVGMIQLEVLYGQYPADQRWGCPVREHWGLTSHQQLSLALEDKLTFTVTATSTYEAAAALAQKGESPLPRSPQLMNASKRKTLEHQSVTGLRQTTTRQLTTASSPSPPRSPSSRYPPRCARLK